MGEPVLFNEAMLEARTRGCAAARDPPRALRRPDRRMDRHRARLRRAHHPRPRLLLGDHFRRRGGDGGRCGTCTRASTPAWSPPTRPAAPGCGGCMAVGRGSDVLEASQVRIHSAVGGVVGRRVAGAGYGQTGSSTSWRQARVLTDPVGHPFCIVKAADSRARRGGPSHACLRRRGDYTRGQDQGGDVLSRKQDAFAEEFEARAAEHLAFEHLDPVDVSFDDAGVPGQTVVAGQRQPRQALGYLHRCRSSRVPNRTPPRSRSTRMGQQSSNCCRASREARCARSCRARSVARRSRGLAQCRWREAARHRAGCAPGTPPRAAGPRPAPSSVSSPSERRRHTNGLR